MRRALDWLVVDGQGHAIPIVPSDTVLSAAVASSVGASASGVHILGLEAHQVLDLEANADPLADGMIMVRRHQ